MTEMAGYEGDGSYGLAASLPRLKHETELQKMLTDEKMRSEQHKTNYQTLKAEHTRLQDEYVTLQKDMKTTIEECRLVQEKYKTLLEQARSSLAEKHAECETLRGQALDPRKMESLKLQVQGETEKPFRDKFGRLDQELDHYRTEYNKIKYEYSFLKSEYEHEQAEHQRVLDEMKLRHEAEVTNLRRERETMIARQQTNSANDTQHMRLVQRENVTLNLKVKDLLSELEEIRAQREHAGLQSDSVTRLQVKQLTENQATIKALEMEKQSLRLQVDSLQRELTLAGDHQSQMAMRTHELEKENQILKNRAEEVQHRSKLDVSNIRMDMLRERGELERERDKLGNQLEDVRSEVEMLKHSLLDQEAQLVNKERENVARMQALREEEWQKYHSLETEKMDLESRLQEMEKRRLDAEADIHVRTERSEEVMRKAQDLKEAAERELGAMRGKLQNQQTLLDQIERMQTDNTDLRTRLQRLETQYESYVDGERDLIALNERLEHEADALRQEAQKARDAQIRDREQAEASVSQGRLSWMEEKISVQNRIDDLDSKLAASARKLASATNVYKQKKARMKSLVIKLKDRVSHLQQKVDQLEIEKEAIKRSIPAEAHEQLKKRLRDLLQRNREFRALLQAGNVKQADIGGLQFGCLSPDFLPAISAFFDTNQKDLSMLRDRIELLDSTQRHQLDELKSNSALYTSSAGIATVTPPGGPYINTDTLSPGPPPPIGKRSVVFNTNLSSTSPTTEESVAPYGDYRRNYE